MSRVFSPIYIGDHEVLFYVYLASMLIIMVLTLIFVVKEVKKKWV